MGTLSDRIGFLTRRYGSDPSAWQGEIQALASLETSDPKTALARFHDLKRRLAEFRRAELLRALRAFAFVDGVPSSDTRGFALKEIEADIRAASRALALARAIASSKDERARIRESLRRRAAPSVTSDGRAPWNDLAALAQREEAARRAFAREARIDQRIVDVERRARKLAHTALTVPDASGLAPDLADAALAAAETQLAAAETLEDAYDEVVRPLKAPDVATYLHQSRAQIEREAKARLAAGDVEGLRALAPKAEVLRVEAARKASEAARARRRGLAGPERERRPGDTIDGYG